MVDRDYRVDAPEEKLAALYGLPRQVLFCRRCVVSNQRPSSVVEQKSTGKEKKPTIDFDAEGVCSACRYAEYKASSIDWAEREHKLKELCDRYRSRNGSYDCIVPGSGGKDSAFTAHALKFKYGMNPLTVTWAPHSYTTVGWNNFQSWIHSGLDNILYTPNGKVHRTLTRLAFENLCHPFQPFIIGQRLLGPRIAAMYGVPLIFYGENQAEYGNNIRENDLPTMDPTFFSLEHEPSQIVLGGVTVESLIGDHGIRPADLSIYFPTHSKKLKEIDAQVHYLGYYIRWDPQEMFYYAVENTGFNANDVRTEGSYSKYSSIDDKLDPLHYFTTYIKFGIGRATYDAAQEVRNGKITRDEAVALVRRYDHEVPTRYLAEMLEYMEITEARFWEVIDAARSPHLWARSGAGWTLRNVIS
jgi:N-acetyl sugar amidotransferase